MRFMTCPNDTRFSAEVYMIILFETLHLAVLLAITQYLLSPVSGMSCHSGIPE